MCFEKNEENKMILLLSRHSPVLDTLYPGLHLHVKPLGDEGDSKQSCAQVVFSHGFGEIGCKVG